jgi:acyl-CoA thioesterase-1
MREGRSLSRKLIPYAGALLLLQGLAACAGENDPQAAASEAATQSAGASAAATTPAADSKLVLAFGDSLYAGYGVKSDESFPAKLEKALVAQGIATKVVNAGVSGNTTAAALSRLAFTLEGLERKPDLAMISLGGNDMLRGIDPAETRANLTKICEELKRRGIPILLTGMIAAPNMGRDYVDRFNAIYVDLAKTYGATLYPFFLDGVIMDRTLMLPDHVHPNPKGIDVIVGKVEPLVAKSLTPS